MNDIRIPTPPYGVPSYEYLIEEAAMKAVKEVTSADRKFTPKSLIPWVIFGVSILGAVAGAGSYIYFSQREGVELKRDFSHHVEDNKKDFGTIKSDIKENKSILQDVSKAVLKIQIKNRAGDWRKAAKKLEKQQEEETGEGIND